MSIFTKEIYKFNATPIRIYKQNRQKSEFSDHIKDIEVLKQYSHKRKNRD